MLCIFYLDLMTSVEVSFSCSKYVLIRSKFYVFFHTRCVEVYCSNLKPIHGSYYGGAFVEYLNQIFPERYCQMDTETPVHSG